MSLADAALGLLDPIHGAPEDLRRYADALDVWANKAHNCGHPETAARYKERANKLREAAR